MARYSIGNAGGDSNDAGEPTSVLWNPHGSIALRVIDVEITVSAAFASGTRVNLSRVTTQGTAASSLTPDADDHFGRRNAPPSGALMGKGNYTAAPTIETPPLLSTFLGTTVGCSTRWWFPAPIIVPPGTGLALVVGTAGSGCVHTWTWEE